jgi:hypothetical protein
MAEPYNLSDDIELQLRIQAKQLERRSLAAKVAFIAIEAAVIVAVWLEGWGVAGVVAAIAATVGAACFIFAEQYLKKKRELVQQGFEWVRKRERDLEILLEYELLSTRAAQLRAILTPHPALQSRGDLGESDVQKPPKKRTSASNTGSLSTKTSSKTS